MAVSAGILLWRRRAGAVEVLLAHPGGPFWRRRDRGAWMIPKGEIAPGESAEDAARREFAEELGAVAAGPLAALGDLRQRGGKQVIAFALEGDFDPATLRGNTFELEWPPHGGRMLTFPEVDRVAWFPLAGAADAMLPSQTAVLERLRQLLDNP